MHTKIDNCIKTVLFFIIVFLMPYVKASAQNISVFTDKLDRFYVFDDGKIEQLSHLPVTDYQIGGDYVIFVHPRGEMMHYKNGDAQMLDIKPDINTYTATGDLLFIKTPNNFELIGSDSKRQKIALGNDMTYQLGDSIFAFINYDGFFKVFFEGEVNNVRAVGAGTVKNFKAGDNTLAYITNSGIFNLSYRGGEAEEIETNPPVSYQVGNDFVVYINNYNELNVFDRGEVESLENIKPKSMKVGDNILAYIDDRDRFMVYFDGEKKEISPYKPASYDIKDNTLIYIDDQKYLNVFYEGENYVLEAYQPKTVKFADGVVAYTDLKGRLKGFYEGEKVKVSDRIIDSFEVNERVIQYTFNNGEVKIYHEGKTYQP